MPDKIKVSTKYGLIEDVPLIQWDKMQPYWASLVRSMAEIITENKFPPHPANQQHPNGIVLSTHYWSGYGKKGFNYSNAVKFLNLLKLNDEFRTAIRAFNGDSNVDWLDNRSVAMLGGRIYGFYFTLRPIFTEDFSKVTGRQSVRFKNPK